jgi:ABC-type phosphate transport system substrate-binding protein
MKQLTFLFVATMLLLTAQTRSSAQQGYRIIVHLTHTVDSVPKSKVSQLLLKKVSKWEDGTKVQPVDLESKSPVRAAVSRDVHGRSVSSIKIYWQRQIFSGREVPPPEFDNEAQVIDFVSKNPGSIGYVSANAKLTTVKELTVSN